MSPVLSQKFIFRSDLRSNPDVLYLFGDNTLRQGFGGQAKEMRGEPNAVGVATKVAPGMREGDFFSDRDIYHFKQVVDKDLARAFNHVRNGGIVVIPEDGLGTGLSELPTRAPKLHAYLSERLAALRNEGVPAG